MLWGLLGGVVSSGLFLLIFFLAKNWLLIRLKASIKNEYDRALKYMEFEQEIKYKSEIIAELVSQWIKGSTDYQKLNELSFKAFLWLPKELAIELSQCLSNQDNAPSAKEIIAKVRENLLGKNEVIDPNIIIHFKEKEKMANKRCS